MNFFCGNINRCSKCSMIPTGGHGEPSSYRCYCPTPEERQREIDHQALLALEESAKDDPIELSKLNPGEVIYWSKDGYYYKDGKRGNKRNK